MKYSTAISSAALLALASAVPTRVEKRADSCGQWDTVETGSYTVYNNLWNKDSADSGSQCFGVDSLDGNSISWHASWTWTGGQGQVKSYPNARIDGGQQISAISSMPSSWSWSYSGDGLIADVAYDMFTSSSAGGDEEFEIMVWLGALGGAGPISSTYGADGSATPVATTNIAGEEWNLYKGPNGQMTVFSFLSTSGNVESFSGDMKDFFDFLVSDQGYDDSQYLLNAGAGTEPFEGSNAVFTTSEYSLSVE